MDHLKQDLDELMGKDRNYPLHIRLSKREHFDNPDVCKYFLIAFCPHSLFPNTRADLKPCKKRHDQFFKDMFSTDPNKEYYTHKYMPDLMKLLEDQVRRVDDRIRKSNIRIDAPMPDSYSRVLEEQHD